MRKIIFTIACIAIALVAKAQDGFSRDVVLEADKGSTIVLKSTAESYEKKEAIPLAIKSAFDTYLFAGIENINDGKPVLTSDARTEFDTYFHRLYEENRYRVFTKSTFEVEKPKKQQNKKYRATVLVEIYKNALEKDLINSKLIDSGASKDVIEKIEDEIVMPTIMVVPYRGDNETFKIILSKDFDKRVAVGKVQDEFREIGIETVDFEAKYNAALRSHEFETNMADAFDTQLIKNSGADVYVTVDINKSSTTAGNSVTLSLKAYDTATGRVLASKQVASDRYRTGGFDKLCMFAVKKVSKEFLSDISGSLAKKATAGSTVALRVSIDGSSFKSLDDEVAGSDFAISDVIRSWLRKNAVGGKFHQQGKTDLAIIFDNINIPNKTPEGELQDATDFATRLTRYLKKKGINASNRMDGSTIYITIKD